MQTATLPEQFGRYRILRKLGAGGMGTVYLAHDSQLERDVALKVPHFGPEDGSNVIERFKREARLAAGYQHSNVCPVYDVGCVDGVHYLTMPFIEGVPLSKRVGQPWPPLAAVTLVARLASTLAVLHARNLIHRDLKPANIMLRPGDDPVVMDFGLARSTTGTDRMTATGAPVGTPAYMSPEQILGDPVKIGPATDIFSLGIILYELLTGHSPFPGLGHACCYHILHEKPAAPGLGSELDELCLKALAKKSADRYASMAEFAAALDVYRGHSAEATTQTLVQPKTAPPTMAEISTPPPSHQITVRDVPRREIGVGPLLLGATVAASLVALGVAVAALLVQPRFFETFVQRPARLQPPEPKVVAATKARSTPPPAITSEESPKVEEQPAPTVVLPAPELSPAKEPEKPVEIKAAAPRVGPKEEPAPPPVVVKEEQVSPPLPPPEPKPEPPPAKPDPVPERQEPAPLPPLAKPAFVETPPKELPSLKPEPPEPPAVPKEPEPERAPVLRAGVADRAGLFSPDVVQAVNERIHKIDRRYKTPLIVETVARLPADKAGEMANLPPADRRLSLIHI